MGQARDPETRQIDYKQHGIEFPPDLALSPLGRKLFGLDPWPSQHDVPCQPPQVSDQKHNLSRWFGTFFDLERSPT